MGLKLVFVDDTGKIFEPEHLEAFPSAQLEALANEELARYSEFFRQIDGNSDLIGPERAILKTYIWWKTHPTGSTRLPSQETNAQESSS